MMDLEALLSPISESLVAGEDLRLSASDASLSVIRKRHRELSRGQEDPSPGDWRELARDCEKALAGSSKDLEVAYYLALSASQVEGLAGVEAGLAVIVGLCERFWDELHPGREGDGVDLEMRGRPLSALGGADMLRGVSQCALLAAPGGDATLCWEDYTYSLIVDRHSGGSSETKKKHQELLAAGRMSGSEWREALLAAGSEALEQACERLSACEGSLRALRQIIDKRWGRHDEEASGEDHPEEPTVAPLEALLGEIREHLEVHLPRLHTSGQETGEPEALLEPAGAPAEQSAPASLGPIRSREDALRQLALIGEYFRETEPHSPLAAICTRAVRWGRMPFEDVLRDVLEDESALAKLWNAVGIDPRPKG